MHRSRCLRTVADMSDGIRERNESASSHGARPAANDAASQSRSGHVSVDVDAEWQTTVGRLLDAFARITGGDLDQRQRSVLAEIGHAVVEHPDTDVQMTARPRPAVVVANGAVESIVASRLIRNTATEVEHDGATVRITLD